MIMITMMMIMMKMACSLFHLLNCSSVITLQVTLCNCAMVLVLHFALIEN